MSMSAATVCCIAPTKLHRAGPGLARQPVGFDILRWRARKVNGPVSVHVARHERHRRIRQRDITPRALREPVFAASKPEAHFVLLPPDGVGMSEHSGVGKSELPCACVSV
jgi:hypothetical protein